MRRCRKSCFSWLAHLNSGVAPASFRPPPGTRKTPLPGCRLSTISTIHPFVARCFSCVIRREPTSMSGGVSWHSRKGVFLHSAVLSSHEAFFSHCWCYVLSAALFRLFSFIPVENHMILNPDFASGPLASKQSRRKRMRRVSWRMTLSPFSTVRFCPRGGVRKGPARAHETHVVSAAHYEVQ